MTKKSAAFIFDMDGTIIDNMHFHTQAWLSFLDSVGIAITQEQLEQQNYGKIEEIFRRICGEQISDAEAVAYGKRKEAMYRDIYRPHLQLIPGLKEFLDAAYHLQIPMALATSAGQDNIDFVLDGLEINFYFDAVIGGDDVKQGKPHPETFLVAAQRLNVPPQQCIVFEDTLPGIIAAQNAGMKAVAVATTDPTQTFAAPVERVIQDYTAIAPATLLETVFSIRSS